MLTKGVIVSSLFLKKVHVIQLEDTEIKFYNDEGEKMHSIDLEDLLDVDPDSDGFEEKALDFMDEIFGKLEAWTTANAACQE